MEESGVATTSGRSIAVENHWWWAAASSAQLVCAISSFKKGRAGSSNLMPLKAFIVASLFVGSGATAAVASLSACGVHSVEDMMAVGASIRSGLGIRPRVREE